MLSSKFRFTPQHILYGKLRPYLNKVYLPDFAGLCSTDFYVIRPHENQVLRQFLAEVLRHHSFVGFATARSVGVNLPRVSSATILEYPFILPPLSIQQQVVAILEQIESVRRLRTDSEALRQQLVQSIFLDMFGNPVRNERGWQVDTIEHLVRGKNGISCGPFGLQLKVSDYVNEGVLVLGIDNIGDNEFVWKNPRYITNEKYADLQAFTVNPGDIIISRAGTIGKMCIVPDSVHNAIIGSNLLKVKLDDERIIPQFFTSTINLAPSIIEKMKMSSPGALYNYLNSKNLRKMEIIIPPLPLQQKFACVIERVGTIRDRHRQSAKEIATLHDALVQRAFAGELVA